MEDTFVEEVRETRQRIFAECGNDLKRLFERLRTAELNDRDLLVSLDDVRQLAQNGSTQELKSSK